MTNDNFKNSEYENGAKQFLNQNGDIPPPWVFSPNSHPYSIQWRMGTGEFYKMIFLEWFRNCFKSIDERIQFFKKYPPPPRWLGWLVEVTWNLTPLEEDFDYSEYFEKLKAEGFDGTNSYLQDFNDEQWE